MEPIVSAIQANSSGVSANSLVNSGWSNLTNANLDVLQEPLSHTTNASSRALTTAIRAFDSFLSHIDVLSSPRLALLSSRRLSSDIHRQALKRIVEAYEKVYDAVMDESNRYEFRTTVLHRSKEEVSTLLAA